MEQVDREIKDAQRRVYTAFKLQELVNERMKKSTQIVCRHYKGCFCDSCKYHKKIVADCRNLLGIGGRFKRNN